MEIKEIYVEAKKSKNFQTYTFGELIALNGGEQNPEMIETIRKEAITRCRHSAQEQIEGDSKWKIKIL